MPTASNLERINVSLPKRTIVLIDRVWQQARFKSRSEFLDEAARLHAMRLQRTKLKRQLKAGYLARAERDLQLVNEWEVASTELLNDEPNDGNR
jgi:metal-responsive CopG/Arc/MetJ family transcriptional regulator